MGGYRLYTRLYIQGMVLEIKIERGAGRKSTVRHVQLPPNGSRKSTRSITIRQGNSTWSRAQHQAARVHSGKNSTSTDKRAE
jgi:hypothetical protein